MAFDEDGPHPSWRRTDKLTPGELHSLSGHWHTACADLQIALLRTGCGFVEEKAHSASGACRGAVDPLDPAGTIIVRLLSCHSTGTPWGTVMQAGGPETLLASIPARENPLVELWRRGSCVAGNDSCDRASIYAHRIAEGRRRQSEAQAFRTIACLLAVFADLVHATAHGQSLILAVNPAMFPNLIFGLESATRSGGLDAGCALVALEDLPVSCID